MSVAGEFGDMSFRSSYHDSQLELFRARSGEIAARDARDLMSWPFFSLAKSRRVTPIDFRMGEVLIRVEATAEHGMATIWDADVLIWAASQIVDARDRGLRTSRLMAATPYEILTFIGRGDSALSYDRLKAALDRLHPRPLSPRSASRPSGAGTAFPGSTNGRSGWTETAGLSASNSSFRIGSTPAFSTMC